MSEEIRKDKGFGVLPLETTAPRKDFEKCFPTREDETPKKPTDKDIESELEFKESRLSSGSMHQIDSEKQCD